LAGETRHRHTEAAQEVVEGIVGEGVLAPHRLLLLLDDADIDDGRTHLLDEVAKIGQSVAVGCDERGARCRLGMRGGNERHAGQQGGDGNGKGGGEEWFAHDRVRKIFDADSGGGRGFAHPVPAIALTRHMGMTGTRIKCSRKVR